MLLVANPRGRWTACFVPIRLQSVGHGLYKTRFVHKYFVIFQKSRSIY